MKIVTSLYAKEVVLFCPHCDKEQSGFLSDPTGGEFECDDCRKPYKIHPEADIEHR